MTQGSADARTATQPEESLVDVRLLRHLLDGLRASELMDWRRRRAGHDRLARLGQHARISQSEHILARVRHRRLELDRVLAWFCCRHAARLATLAAWPKN